MAVLVTLAVVEFVWVYSVALVVAEHMVDLHCTSFVVVVVVVSVFVGSSLMSQCCLHVVVHYPFEYDFAYSVVAAAVVEECLYLCSLAGADTD